jgi:hypothetical protein
MLKAILEGKAGRVELEDGNSQSWRDVFQRREDLLTAVFFGRFRYLSPNGEQQSLALLIGRTSAEVAGSIHRVDFWPKFPLAKRRHVEPDVVIECDNATILVEVKPPFGGDQFAQQWENEIRGLINDRYAEDDLLMQMKHIHFVGLGRNFAGWQDEAKNLEANFSNYSLRVHAKEWELIRDGIDAMLISEEGRDRAVYEDWMAAFSLFGMNKKLLLFTDMEQMPTVRDEWKMLFSDWKPL